VYTHFSTRNVSDSPKSSDKLEGFKRLFPLKKGSWENQKLVEEL
jgi:hypothetical protein